MNAFSELRRGRRPPFETREGMLAWLGWGSVKHGVQFRQASARLQPPTVRAPRGSQECLRGRHRKQHSHKRAKVLRPEQHGRAHPTRPKTTLDRRGSSCGAEWTMSQHRREFLETVASLPQTSYCRIRVLVVGPARSRGQLTIICDLCEEGCSISRPVTVMVHGCCAVRGIA